MCSWCPGHQVPACPDLLLQPICPGPAGLQLPLQGCQVLPPLEGLLQLGGGVQVGHLACVLLEHHTQLPLMLCLHPTCHAPIMSCIVMSCDIMSCIKILRWAMCHSLMMKPGSAISRCRKCLVELDTDHIMSQDAGCLMQLNLVEVSVWHTRLAQSKERPLHQGEGGTVFCTIGLPRSCCST